MRKFRIVIKILAFLFTFMLIFFFFKNIEKFMPNYEGKVMNYSNKYSDSQGNSSPLEFIQRITVGREFTEQEKQLLNINIVTNLYEKSIKKQKERLAQILQTVPEEYTDEYVIPETKYGDIIYQVNELYDTNRKYHITHVLFFTKDQKKIYYYKRSNNQVTKDSIWLEVNKVLLLEELQQFVLSLNIPITEFKPSIISKKNNAYYIKDEKQNIEIVYDINNSEIKEFNYNF